MYRMARDILLKMARQFITQLGGQEKKGTVLIEQSLRSVSDLDIFKNR